MHWKNLTNYNYLGAYSLESEPTNQVILTIKAIKSEIVTTEGGKQDKCLVADFVEKQVGTVIVKPMIFNKTNCKRMQKLFNSAEVENWIGKQIIVYSTTCKMGKNPNTPCLRIKDELPKQTKIDVKTEEVKEEVKEEHYYCEVCGKEISKKYYDGFKQKYGVAVCSQECLNKYNEGKGE